MKSGIRLVEDLFSKGAFKDITEFSNLICKINWLCEYKILKNVFMKIKPNERCILKKEYMFCLRNDMEDSEMGKTCKFFNELFVAKKFERSHMESTCEKLFDYQKSDWGSNL